MILSLKDIKSFSYDYFQAENFIKSYDILIKGLSKFNSNENIDKKLLSEYYELLGIIVMNDIKEDYNQLTEYNLTLMDAKKYFDESIKMNNNIKILYIYMSMIYDYEKDDDNFYLYLEKALDSGYDNFDQLEFKHFNSRQNEEKFIDLIKKYK